MQSLLYHITKKVIAVGLFDSVSKSVSGFVNNQLGFNSGLSSGVGRATNIPWGSDFGTDPFFKSFDIKGERWNQVYPYRLMVIDVTKGNKIVNKTGAVSPSSSGFRTSYFVNGDTYTISQQHYGASWVFELPITPQQLSIIDTFAINTTATMRGVVEEHNGTKFKIINMSGTTGIYPSRPSIGASLASPTILGSAFGGTLEAAKSFVGSVGKIKSAIFGGGNKSNSLPPMSDSGYYNALLLGQFLERYAQEKKNPANKGWRLVFDIPKQNQSFVVTPLMFSLDQSQQRPSEYLFKIQLKAWKRIDLKAKNFDKTQGPNKLTPNLFQKAVKTIAATRRAIGEASNTITAVKGDIRNIANIVRQTTLAIKDLGGLVVSLADMPQQIIDELKGEAKEKLKISAQFTTQGNSSEYQVDPTTADRNKKTVQDMINKDKENEGLSTDAVASGAIGSNAAAGLAVDNSNEVFDNPEKNFDLFDSIDLNSLTLTPEQQDLINAELENARLLTIEDFKNFRSQLLTLMNNLSDSFGTGDITYAGIYGLPTPKSRDIPISLEENELLMSFMEAIQVYDSLVATKSWDDNKVQSPLEYVGTLANNAGIDFQQFPSKYLVPVPFGLTVEEIAARYLGSPDRWIEIVTINNLRSPYIDDVGFIYNLLSNAEGRQFTVNDELNQLYIGQVITLKSDTVSSFTRIVNNIEKISDTLYLITVDGLANLDSLKLSENAQMHGYLPGTLSSQDQIFIPTDAPSTEDDRSFEIPQLEYDQLNKISKIDLLLTDNYDIAINAVGDFRLANGLNNLVQALKLKIRTKKHSLLRHLEFGLGLSQGVSVADIESGKIIDELNKIIEDDDRFEGVDRIEITLTGATLAISMAVKVANNSGVVPITFEI